MNEKRKKNNNPSIAWTEEFNLVFSPDSEGLSIRTRSPIPTDDEEYVDLYDDSDHVHNQPDFDNDDVNLSDTELPSEPQNNNEVDLTDRSNLTRLFEAVAKFQYKGFSSSQEEFVSYCKFIVLGERCSGLKNLHKTDFVQSKLFIETDKDDKNLPHRKQRKLILIMDKEHAQVLWNKLIRQKEQRAINRRRKKAEKEAKRKMESCVTILEPTLELRSGRTLARKVRTTKKSTVKDNNNNNNNNSNNNNNNHNNTD